MCLDWARFSSGDLISPISSDPLRCQGARKCDNVIAVLFIRKYVCYNLRCTANYDVTLILFVYTIVLGRTGQCKALVPSDEPRLVHLGTRLRRCLG